VRILIYGINFSPELTGIGKYSGELAAWLSARGHEVRVVTAPPYYPDWRVGAGYAGWRYRREDMAGAVRVFRCPLWVPARPSGLKRLLHLASFALSSLPLVLWQAGWRPQVVLVVAPALFCAPGGWLAARLCGARAWLHIQDFEVDAAFGLGLLKGGLLRRAVLAGERWLLRRFDRVSTISRRMLALLAEKGVPDERLVLFPNWVDLRGLQFDAGGVADLRAELGIAADAVIALYSGNMGAKQGLGILAKAATLLREDARLQFVFCGNGAGRADLMARCARLKNVRFLDLQPAERLGALLGMADIHLLPQRADAADLVMPSKLTGMLASGRPVVATAHAGTEVAEVVQGGGFGLVVPPEDAAAFAGAIAALAADPAQRALIGTAGRAYAEAYLDMDGVLLRFEGELRLSILDSPVAGS
jgi:colanic acid biosynthesis glycosyl transferase WcaI